jgi:hypothetical protein
MRVLIKDHPNYSIDITGLVINNKTNKYLKIQLNQKREIVELWKDNKKKHCQIHRLLAEAFIPNPDNLPQINHIDGNSLNNKIENLEWVTDRDNKLHAYRTGLMKQNKFAVLQYTLNEKFVREYESILEAHRVTKIDRKSIKFNIENKYKHAGNYIWRLKK